MTTILYRRCRDCGWDAPVHPAGNSGGYYYSSHGRDTTCPGSGKPVPKGLVP